MTPNPGHVIDAIFAPLDLRKLEIRLVILHPAATEDAALVCSLDSIFLSVVRSQAYEALSWCWGNQDDTETITLQGSSWQTPQTLTSALKILRRNYEFRFLWIDALCINQANTVPALLERGQQVQLMKRIYACAENVVVWLGTAQPWTDTFFTSLRKLSGRTLSQDDAVQEMVRHGYHGGTRNLSFVNWLWDFIRRPWWRRAWILQEIILASFGTMLCGSCHISVTDALSALVMVQQSWKSLTLSRADGERFVSLGAYVDMIRDLDTLGVSCLLKNNFGIPQVEQHPMVTKEEILGSLAKVLTACRFQLATDPRDKIFGVLGLFPEAVTEYIQPDYQISYQAVYVMTALTIIKSTQSLFLLSQAQISVTELRQLHNGLPSWVPDWSQPRREIGYSVASRARSRLERDKVFKASAGHVAKVSLHDDHVLRTQGFRIGIVNSLHKLWQKEEVEAYNPNLSFFKVWIEEYSQHSGQQPDPQTSLLNAIKAWWATFMHDIQPIEVSATLTRCTDDCITICETWRKQYQSYVNQSQVTSSTVKQQPYTTEALNSTLPLFPFPSLIHPRSFTCLRFFTASPTPSNIGQRQTNRLLGFGVSIMQPGDHIFILAGATHPFILRPADQRVYLQAEQVVQPYRIICECYVHGMMDGEAVEAQLQGSVECRESIWEDIYIV